MGRRLAIGRARPGHARSDALTEAFQWSEQRTVTKTATVSLHGNTYEVEAVLVGCKVELVFSPFDLETIEVHYRGAHYGRAVPFRITRHAHPKARPETTEPAPAVDTGIAYLQLVADTHQQQVAGRGTHRLPRPLLHRHLTTAQLPGQLSIDDALASAVMSIDGNDDTAVRS